MATSKKQKPDESNTLFVIALPDGQIKKAVSKWHVMNVLDKLELQCRIRMEEGKPIAPETFLKLVQDAVEQIRSMKDPTIDREEA